MIVAFVLAVLPTVVSVALFAGIGTLIVRGDLVAETIRDGMRPPKTAGRQRRRDAGTAGEWTAAAEALADVPVLPAVRVQVLYNRVRRFRADRLDALRKRLELADKRLADATRKGRRARVAYKFELSQVIAAMVMFSESYENYGPFNTATAATYTDAYAAEDTTGSSVKSVGTVMSDGSDDGLRPATSTGTVSEQNVDGLSDQLKSLYETVCELAACLVGATVRLKDTLTSERCRRRAVFACQLVRYVFTRFEAQHFRYVARTAVDVFEKFVEIDINVYSATEKTSIEVKLFPAVKNVRNASDTE